MTWYFIYDLATGAREGTANFRLDDAIYAAQGRGQIPYDDGFNIDNMMVDITQTPPVIIPIPPSPSPAE